MQDFELGNNMGPVGQNPVAVDGRGSDTNLIVAECMAVGCRTAVDRTAVEVGLAVAACIVEGERTAAEVVESVAEKCAECEFLLATWVSRSGSLQAEKLDVLLAVTGPAELELLTAGDVHLLVAGLEGLRIAQVVD